MYLLLQQKPGFGESGEMPGEWHCSLQCSPDCNDDPICFGLILRELPEY